MGSLLPNYLATFLSTVLKCVRHIVMFDYVQCLSCTQARQFDNEHRHGTPQYPCSMTQALCRLNDLDFENLTPTFLKQVVQLLAKTMIGEEIARELVDAISVEYGATVNRLLAAIHDRASVNGVAMKTITIDMLPFNGM